MTASKGAAARPAYARAGVNVAAGGAAVELMRAAVESTRRPEVIGGLGGFAGAISIPPGYREPIVVAATDGVGTKTAIAMAAGRWDTIGIDLVAMCADDVVCAGAEPLAFLDYLAVGELDPEAVAEIVGGVAAGCRDAGCALIGGETAEHPGIMAPETFDLAGTCLGIVERDRLLDGTQARAGDSIVGLLSSGLHSNGFSLVRALLANWDIDLATPYQEQLSRSLGEATREAVMAGEPEHGFATLGEVLLTPTRIYARAILLLREALAGRGSELRGVAHVTGGGLPGNVPRALPPDLGARLDPSRWRMPSVMTLFGALGGVDATELRATFNGGIGMVVIVPPDAAALAIRELAGSGFAAALIGEVRLLDDLGGSRYVEGRLEGDRGDAGR